MFGIIILILAFTGTLAWLWAGGIDYMAKNHPDYKGEDLFGEFDKEDTPEDKEHNKKVFDLSTKIEEDEWEELFTILRGQNHKEYIKMMQAQSEEEKWKTDLWTKWFDGSGMKHWWD